jgi:hypothetical protein
MDEDRREDGNHCPNCGRYANGDDGFYAWIAAEPDFISLFCNMACCNAYEAKVSRKEDGQ